jgi:hypothetical protein
MATDLSVTANTFTTSKVSFAMGMAKNGRNAPINMKYDGQMFQILLPQAPVRYMSRTDQKTGETGHTLSYTFVGCDNYGSERNTSGNEIGNLFNSLLDLENAIVQTALENSPKWFGKKRSEEGIRESFKRIINVSTDRIDGERVPNGKYPPSWYIKIPVYDGEVKMGRKGIVDKNGKPITVTPDTLSDAFPKSSQAQIAVTGSIYTMTGGGFGVSWKLRAAKVYSGSEVDAAELFGGVVESTPTTKFQEETEVQEETEESERPSTPVEQVQDSVPAVAPSAPARKKRQAAGGH